MGGVQYYLGPLNTTGSPTWNEDKFKNNQTRWIFKSLFKKEISRYFSKKKVSVPDPQALWLRNDLKEFFMDEFISKSFRNNNFFDQKTILKSLNQFHKNKTASSFHLFQIYISIPLFLLEIINYQNYFLSHILHDFFFLILLIC